MAPQTILGPSVIVIGWIPQLKKLPAPLSYRRLGGRLWASMHAVFLLGNAPPPASFVDDNDLRAFLDRRDFRGALWLFRPELTVDDASQAINIDCDDNHEVGYTPYLSFVPGSLGRNHFLRSKRFNSQGEGDEHLLRTTKGNLGVLTKKVWFRLGKTANCVSRLMSGHWAPYAWIEVVYQIDSDGACSITCRGSCVPSQTVYINLQRESEFGMESNSVQATKAFLQAGDGMQAPARSAALVFTC